MAVQRARCALSREVVGDVLIDVAPIRSLDGLKKGGHDAVGCGLDPRVASFGVNRLLRANW